MPGPNMVLDLPYKAAAAIVKFTGVKLTADDTVTTVAASTDVGIGVCQETVIAADVTLGRVCDIRVMGVTRVIAGGTVTRGTRAMFNATGQAITAATAANVVVGIFLTSGVVNDQVNMLLVPPAVLV